jgi:hypothetical protein
MMRAAEDLILDGNAIAGDLAQFFVTEATVAVAVCAHCSAEGPLGGGVLYHGSVRILDVIVWFQRKVCPRGLTSGTAMI